MLLLQELFCLHIAHTATHTTVDRCLWVWGKRNPNRKVGKLTIRRGGHSSGVFTDMTQVTWCLRSLSSRHVNDSGGWGETTSFRLFTLTQNWENFSFTLERKEISHQKKQCRRCAVSITSPELHREHIGDGTTLSLYQCRFIQWVFPGLGCPGAWKDPDKLNLTRFSGYKFLSAIAKVPCRSSAPEVQNELKLELVYTDGFAGSDVRWLGGIQGPLYTLGHYANSG
ncbi:hypothetical protein TNCV_799401 [Trichonephila clavipes]|nr:hypothetical protein TNCV_799401 [Trichonephila clavipes]